MRKKTIIFLVNSLSNGGAERVVVNMANKYKESGYEVIVVCIYQRPSGYKLHTGVQKIILINNNNIPKLKKILYIPTITHRFSKIIKQYEKDHDIVLITSHLIFSNLISKLSRYRKRTINVIHVSYKTFFSHFRVPFIAFLKWLYWNVPVVTVSNGCEKEIADLYAIKTSHISTIYNPIDIKAIQEKSLEKIYIRKRPYLLFVGRLDREKRPELLVDIFYHGEFYKKYNLVIVGAGPLEQTIKNKVEQYGIGEFVDVRGWESNVFPFMKNAELMVNCSNFEAFPMSFAEAFVCNCPVVSFDVDYGPGEILTKDLSKFLAKDGDVNDMITKIRAALDEYATDLSSRVQLLDVSKINSQYLEIYNKWGLRTKNEKS